MTEPDSTTDKSLILLVDDEPGIRLTLSMLLEEEGYRVIAAEDGRHALERLRESRPDLIITDYMMPYLSGLELIKAVRVQPDHAGIPILLMSAALPSNVDPDAIDVAFVHKPADLKQLFELIEQLLNEASRSANR